jgi:hypothetical protein
MTDYNLAIFLFTLSIVYALTTTNIEFIRTLASSIVSSIVAVLLCSHIFMPCDYYLAAALGSLGGYDFLAYVRQQFIRLLTEGRWQK